MNKLLHFIYWLIGLTKKIGASIPFIKSIPAFETLPKGLSASHLRFYKLANLVLTLGMFVHLFWIFLFWYYDVKFISLINIGSVCIYIIGIIINRYGKHFLSSSIMVIEILIFQIIAIRCLGMNAGFQSFVLVIALFPFLMPPGKTHIKLTLWLLCISVYLLFDWINQNYVVLYTLTEKRYLFLRASNIIFSFISLSLSGSYFNNAMKDTELLLEKERDKSNELLLNILPEETAQELKASGKAEPKLYSSVSVLFTDFKNFTLLSESLTPSQLVNEINYYYSAFDNIVTRHDVEKIKTIGDAYMCVAGLPNEYQDHAIKITEVACEILMFIKKEKEIRQKENRVHFDIRIGIHSGQVVAGIVGIKKFAYDVWGDTVNTASRMEHHGEVNRINVSGETFQLLKTKFEFEYRGWVDVKGKGKVEMYFLKA
jgi:class 3 adenylate cyclase